MKWADCVREDWYIVHVTNTLSHKESKTTCTCTLKSVSLNRSSWGLNLTEVLHVCTCASIPNTTVLCDRGHDNTVVTVIAWVTKYGDHQSTAIAGML